MSFVASRSDSGELRSVKYHPAFVRTYGPSGKYESHVPAYVIVDIGDNGTVYLSVPDARALLAALPGVLAEDDATESSVAQAAA